MAIYDFRAQKSNLHFIDRAQGASAEFTKCLYVVGHSSEFIQDGQYSAVKEEIFVGEKIVPFHP